MHSNDPKPLFVVIALIVLSLTIIGCSPGAQATPTSAPANTVLTISGSGTTTSLLTALQPTFEAANPGYTLQILSGSGTGGGVTGVMDSTLDLAAMSRGPKEEETTQGLQYVSLGRGGISVFTHADVGLTNLTSEEVKDVFFGEITNWLEIGGEDLPVIVYVRDEDEAATGVLRAALFGDTPFPATTAAVLTSLRDMLISVEGTVGGIGYGTWPGVLSSKVSVTALAIDGVAPDDASYPYTIELGLGYVEGREEAVQPLLNWLASEAGETALQELGVILTQ